ncbi:M20 family metallopeptidase [Salidesulfovibrio onnuriiensis]|uniref:M20 family metallopeptidase n=1 Tax=Salidesulfovibrio onnuriiensis TaxID=2583823 RepID=UPI0011CBFBA5|nr:M20/M25/M40 family metallo-hydrolase [Salidesulfovibrio onnuriiensis]
MTMLDEIIQLTSYLIRFKTMHSRPEETRACARFILDWCKKHDMEGEYLEHNGVPSIAIMPEAGKRARLMLMSHIDVVDAEEKLFEPRIEGDKLFGRGAGDDKYAAALSLVLFRERLAALRAQGKDRKDMALGVLITGDEETGGPDGAGHALTKVQADYVIALDGGSPQRMVLKEKGIINMTITARGTAAHGARPWLGHNAIEALIRDWESLKALFTEENEEHWHRTVNFGIVRAGESINQVPDVAVGQFNIRYTDNDDPEALVAQIRDAVNGEVEVMRIDPVFASPASKYTDRLLELSGAERVQEHGASDARYLEPNGMAGVVWGAEVFGSIHGANECVSISSIGTLSETLQKLVIELENEN